MKLKTNLVGVFACVCAAGAMLASTAAFADPGENVTSSSYVQNGLVAQWDGIDNGGVGVHGDIATSGWTDLKGGVVLTKTGGDPVTDETGVLLGSKVKLEVYDAGGPATALGHVLGSQIKTVEIVGRDCNGATVVQNMFLLTMAGKNKNDNSNRLFMWYTDADKPVLGTIAVPGSGGILFYSGNDFGLTAGQDFTAAAVFTSATECRRYSNGMPRGTLTVNSEDRSDKDSAAIALHGWYGQDGADTSIHVSAIRVYNRALTAAEVATNNLVDALRFGRARYQGDDLQFRVRAFAYDESARVSVGGETGASVSTWVGQGSNAVLRVVQVPSGKTFCRWIIDGAVAGYDEELTVTVTNQVDAAAEFSVKDWTYANGELTNGDWTFAASGANSAIVVGKPTTIGSFGMVDFTGVITCDGGGTGTIVGFVDEMFRTRSSIEGLKVPESVTEIPQRMVAQCPNLRKVVLHDGITNINHRAFRDTPNLYSFTPMLPSRLQALGVYAFQACPLLKGPVFIPRTLLTCVEVDAIANATAYFDQSGFAEFVVEDGAALPRRLISGQVASIREVKFLGDATWVTGSGDNSSFKFDSSRDKRVRMSVPRDATWKAWMSDAANVTPWDQCASADRETYFAEFGSAADVPFGLTTAAATCRGMWVIPDKTAGLTIFVR